MLKKILFLLLNISIIIGEIFVLLILNNSVFSHRNSLLLIVSTIVIFLISTIFKCLKFHKFSKFSYMIFIISSLAIIIYSILYKYNIIQILSSVNSLKNYILSTEELGVFVYILIQLMQVVFLPIPASVICIVGSLIYGPLLGGVYCTIGVLVGSYISFMLGKAFGFKLVSWVVGINNARKYSNMIAKRGGFFLCIAFLLPMFPDDVLCLIAGITNMSFKSFFWITLITRPIGVICMSYFGSGYIIPFTGWGIYAWIGILVVAVVMIYITYRFQENIENFVLRKIFRKN